MDDEIRKMVAETRGELAVLLAALPAEEWDGPTLCAGWRVREAVAHITMPFRYSGRKFMLELAKSRGNFNAMADRLARRDAAIRSAAELTAAVADNVDHPWKPPGGGFTGALSHDVIHGLDIAVPCGVPWVIPPERLRHVLPASLTERSVKFFRADLAGVEFRASDMDWTLGSGSPLEGAAQDLLLAICGRRLPAGRLKGAPSSRFTSLAGLADGAAGGDLVQPALQDRAGRPLLGQRVELGRLVDGVRGVPALLVQAGPERLDVIRRGETRDVADHRGRGGLM